MERKLSWVKEAFSREITLVEDGQPVGKLHRDFLSRDVEASLNTVHLRFDVMGFLLHSVNIHDLNNDNRIIGRIEFSFGKRADLILESGETYHWKRHNILMRDWDMILEGQDGVMDHEVVNYALTRQFLVDNGDITAEESAPNVEIIILTGLFVRNYFQRRRRAAAGVIAAS